MSRLRRHQASAFEILMRNQIVDPGEDDLAKVIAAVFVANSRLGIDDETANRLVGTVIEHWTPKPEVA